MTVPCPTCDAPVAFPTADKTDRLTSPPAPGHFPFCSERCKLVDLGKWADGTYKVSRPLTPEERAEAERQAASRSSGDDDDE